MTQSAATREPGRPADDKRESSRTRVLVVDDSGVMRRAITAILESAPEFEVVGTAKNGAEAIDLAARLKPDVITMDVAMPRVDGLQALDTIMAQQPIPIVILSAYALPGGKVARKALAAGAVAVVQKPSESGIALDLVDKAEEIRATVRSAARIRVVRTTRVSATRSAHRAGVPNLASNPMEMPILAIGSSTGGLNPLREILRGLPADFPGCVLIVQHMPVGYTAGLAQSLDQAATIHVEEARPGDEMRAATAFLAPGGTHLQVVGPSIRLTRTERVNMHRPSADVLFDSLLPVAPRVCAILLSGMGEDGVEGMVRLRAAGAATIAQDEVSSVVWGMPGAAVKRGCVEAQLAPWEIIPYLLAQQTAGGLLRDPFAADENPRPAAVDYP